MVTAQVTASTRPRWQLPRIDPTERWIGGVAAATAREIGVQPLVVRVAFAILTLAGGTGLLLYALAWALLAVAQPNRLAPYRPEPKAASSLHRHVAVAMVVVGLLLTVRALHLGFNDKLVFPPGFVLTGALIAWTRQKEEAGLSSVLRILAGVSVGLGGIIGFVLLSANLADAALVLLIALALVAGMALVAAPSLARIGRDLDTERQNRVRADERARVAAHLHDSVLQTLALIQRNSGDPVRTAQLARQQERELRQWLYGTAPDQARPGFNQGNGPTRLEPVLEAMGADVDAAHGVPVTVVAVGDLFDIDRAEIEPLVAATREAVVNAAIHSGARAVDVYAERHPNRIEIFVRDTGHGFDPEMVPGDRRGVADSIIGRMQRAGGTVTISSSPETGTEVELILPLRAGLDADQEVTS
jgi:signal transduction histidine kinase